MIAIETTIPEQFRMPPRVADSRYVTRAPWVWSGLRLFLPLTGSMPEYEQGIGHYGRVTYGGGARLANSELGLTITLDGVVTSYARLPAAGKWVIGGLDRWTIMVVFRKIVLAQDGVLFCERAASGNDVVKMETWGAGLVVTYRDDAGTLDQYGGGALIRENVWEVATIVRSATGFDMYINGQFAREGGPGARTASNTLTDANPIMSIGSDIQAVSGDVTLNGDIALVAAWDRAFTAQEVAAVAKDPFGWFTARRSAVILTAAAAARPPLWAFGQVQAGG